MKRGGGKARGFDLLRQVYAELYTQLGDRFSPAELLQAAQTLIDVSRDEYGNTLFKESHLHPGYYSLAVDVIIEKRPWLALENEPDHDHAREDDFDMSHRVSQRLKKLFGPITNFKREYW